MTILLLRHGETLLNAARVMQPADTPLGPRGLAQAAAAAPRLAALRPAALLASDLPRAWQTAQAVAAATGLAIEASALLRERDFGAWRGLPYDSLPDAPSDVLYAPPGGESMAEFEARIDAAWVLVRARRAVLDGPLIVVSHGLLIRALLQRHARLGPGQLLPARLANTSVSELDATPPFGALRIDCTAHLTAAVPGPGG